MAYDRDKIFKQAKTAIEKKNLFFIEDIVAFIPCNKDTFYRFFPTNSDEYDTLKEALEQNKIRTKSSIRAKLYAGSRANELIALYKLICTDEERKSLSMTYQKVDYKKEDEDLSGLSNKELAERIKMLHQIKASKNKKSE